MTRKGFKIRRRSKIVTKTVKSSRPIKVAKSAETTRAVKSKKRSLIHAIATTPTPNLPNKNHSKKDKKHK